MSYFTVIVVGDDVDTQLAPYHEFECSGRDDEFVQNVDQTERYREQYDKDEVRCLVKGTETLIEYSCQVKGYFCAPLTKEQAQQIESLGPFLNNGDLPPGVIRVFDKYVQFRPEDFGYERAKRPAAQLYTFLEWVVDYDGLDKTQILGPNDPTNSSCKYEYVRVDESGEVVSVIRRTNPNAKWDYYSVGGRWDGYFPTRHGNVNSCQWGSVDWEKAREGRRQNAEAAFDEWRAIYELHGKAKSLEEVAHGKFGKAVFQLERSEWLAARDSWSKQPAIIPAMEITLKDPVEEFGYDRDAYIEKQVQKTLMPVAILKDGTWHQKGRMGWFGVLSDSMSDEDWHTHVHDIYSGLSAGTKVTIVACHI